MTSPGAGSGDGRLGSGGAPPSPRPGRRTATIALSSALLLWAVATYFGSGALWPLAALLALLIGGVVGGSAAGRWFDVLALAVGGAFGIIVTGAIQPLEPGVPSDFRILVPAALAGGILVVIAGATFAVGRLVGPARRPLVGVGLAVLIAAGWFLLLVRDDDVAISSYWIVDDRTIGVEVDSGQRDWCRVTHTAETAADVRVTARCLTWLPSGPGTAELWRFRLTVPLAQPLGDRRVLDGEGLPVRLVRDPNLSPTQYP
jgi:hypothetical protein